MSADNVPVQPGGLSRWTAARVDLGRAGTALPTAPLLEFTADHALARDAVWKDLDTVALAAELERCGFATLCVHSRAATRAEYLRRPDLGRLLAAECEASLETEGAVASRLTVVVADGLSAAASVHAPDLLCALREGLEGWELDEVVIATQARVALGDAIGERRRAEAVLVLIGERPGLRATNSLGAYLTYAPRVGRTDAERNCVSNIRPGGLGCAEAARTLLYLVRGARALQQTGVLLKDNSADEQLTQPPLSKLIGPA